MSVYLDHAATTPLRPEVLDAMLPYLTEHFGNPSSIHGAGRRARLGLDEARETVARIARRQAARDRLHRRAAPRPTTWPSRAPPGPPARDGRHVVTSSVEHKAVLHACAVLERFGFEVTYLPVDRYGRVDPADVAAAIRDHTTVVSVMYANNEVGTIQPIARDRRHLPRAQASSSTSTRCRRPASCRSTSTRCRSTCSAWARTSSYGPKGVGALFVRQGTALLTQLSGGSQERQRRAGTENVAGIVGLRQGAGAGAGRPGCREAENARLARLRDQLIAGLTALPGVTLTGHPTDRLPNSASFLVDGVEGGDLVAALDLEGIAASTGSACTTGSAEPSHVLLAMGFEPEQAHGSLRLTLGLGTTEDGRAIAPIEVMDAVLVRMRAGMAERAEVASV